MMRTPDVDVQYDVPHRLHLVLFLLRVMAQIYTCIIGGEYIKNNPREI
jgi:hypothetical protein